jgi:chromosome segregation ATPase
MAAEKEPQNVGWAKRLRNLFHTTNRHAFVPKAVTVLKCIVLDNDQNLMNVIFNQTSPIIQATLGLTYSRGAPTEQALISYPDTICFTGHSQRFRDFEIENRKDESGKLIFKSPDPTTSSTLSPILTRTMRSTTTTTVLGPTPGTACGVDEFECTTAKVTNAVLIPIVFFVLLYMISWLLRSCWRCCSGRRKKAARAMSGYVDDRTRLLRFTEGSAPLSDKATEGRREDDFRDEITQVGGELDAMTTRHDEVAPQLEVRETEKNALTDQLESMTNDRSRLQDAVSTLQEENRRLRRDLSVEQCNPTEAQELLKYATDGITYMSAKFKEVMFEVAAKNTHSLEGSQSLSATKRRALDNLFTQLDEMADKLTNAEEQRDQALNAQDVTAQQSEEDVTALRVQRNEQDSALGIVEGGLTYEQLSSPNAVFKGEVDAAIDELAQEQKAHNETKALLQEKNSSDGERAAADKSSQTDDVADDRTEKMGNVRAELATSQITVKTLEEEHEKLTKQTGEAKKDVKGLKEDLGKLNTKNKMNQKLIKQMEETQEECDVENETLKKKHDTLKQKIERLEEEARDALSSEDEDETKEKTERIATLEQELSNSEKRFGNFRSQARESQNRAPETSCSVPEIYRDNDQVEKRRRHCEQGSEGAG